MFAVSLQPDVPDLHLEQPSLVVLVNVDVDGEMGVDVSHLVLEALGDANDQVVDDRSDGAERSDVLARAMVQLNVDDVLFRVREGDGEMAEVLGELASRAFYGDDASLDVDLDCGDLLSVVARLKLARSLYSCAS